MEITWYGLSCFRMMERGQVSVVADPFDHKVTGYPALNLRADIVTVSHDAAGHNHVSAVKGRKHLITGPGEFEIGGVFITGVQTNGNAKRSAGGPRNILYVFDFNGVTVAHLGDLRRAPSQTEIEALGHVSIALVPVGGGGGLTAAKAVEVVSILEPGIVIPMHFSTQGANLKLAPVTKFLKEMGMGKVEPQPTLKITRSGVPDETRVVVLTPSA